MWRGLARVFLSLVLVMPLLLAVPASSSARLLPEVAPSPLNADPEFSTGRAPRAVQPASGLTGVGPAASTGHAAFLIDARMGGIPFSQQLHICLPVNPV